MLEDQTLSAPAPQNSTKRTCKGEMPSYARRNVVNDSAVIDAKVPYKASMTAVLPIMDVVSVAFLVIGMALPVLPLHVHQGLGLSAFVVGLVTGSQFAASLITRVWSGHYADSRGAKRAVVIGLLTAVVGVPTQGVF